MESSDQPIPGSNPESSSDDEEAMQLYTSWKGSTASGSIPKFYYSVPDEKSIVQLKLREEARAMSLERKGKDLLDDEDLKELLSVLQNTTSSSSPNEECMISYKDFKEIGAKFGERYRTYFNARVFAKLLQKDLKGRISVRVFFNYVMRKIWLRQTRIGLCLYDSVGQGYLCEEELENYILELIPTLPQLNGLETSFHSFYVCTAIRKFFFYLDPFRIKKIKIEDILKCSFLEELLELRDENLPKDFQESNWFSAPSALRVYGVYLNLDKDHNGMLSKEELARYGTGTLTPVFIKRVFQECVTFDKEMDYKTYLDFVLALENRKDPQAIQYFFRILDTEQKHYLTVFDLNYFFKAIQQQMRDHGQEPVAFEDVKDEIYDMIKPKDQMKITLKDLISCGQGDTVVNILIDLNGFWTYENRELLLPPETEEVEI